MSLGPLSAVLLGVASALGAPGCGGEAVSTDSTQSEPAPTRRPEPRTPVVLIILDTLRADHLGCYGYPLDTSPVLDEFASSATLFENNSTQVNVTFASITSILTGLYARTHASYVPIPVGSGRSEPRGFIALPGLLSQLGYHTLGVVSHPAWSMEDDSEILRGWNELSFIDPELDGASRRQLAHGAHTNERLFPLFDEYLSTPQPRPLFLWAHYFDPHTDLKGLIYDAPESTRNQFLAEHLGRTDLSEYEEQLAELDPREREVWMSENVEGEEFKRLRMANGRSLYDAEIRSCDEHVGRLFDRLREANLYDESLIVVMADHGENMEGEGHLRGSLLFTHHRLFQGVTRTPLIIKRPGQTVGQRVAAITQNIDVFSTILEILGIPPIGQAEGKSLVPLLVDPEARLHKRVFMESSDQRELAIETNQVKVIDPRDGSPALAFQWKADPKETTDVAPVLDPALLSRARRALREFKPIPELHVRLEPDREPYEASVSVAFGRAEIVRHRGPDGTTVSSDRRRLSWSGVVGSAPVELSITRNHAQSRSTWRIELDGVDDDASRVRVGDRPLANSGAYPLYVPSEAAAPASPVLSIERVEEQEVILVNVRGEAPARIELYLRAEEPSYSFSIEALQSVGFEPAKHFGGRFHSFLAEGVDHASLLATVEPPGVGLLARVAIDGRWPLPREVSLDGRAAESRGVEFVLPRPPIPTVEAALRSDGGAQPPGTVSIREDAVPVTAELDTSEMDPDLVEQLRALGYVR